jgi:hypothetical protein
MPGFHRRQLILGKVALRHQERRQWSPPALFAGLCDRMQGAGAAEMRLPMDQRRRPTPLRAQW